MRLTARAALIAAVSIPLAVVAPASVGGLPSHTPTR